MKCLQIATFSESINQYRPLGSLDPNGPNFGARPGWKCPGCGRIWAPWMPFCGPCNRAAGPKGPKPPRRNYRDQASPVTVDRNKP